MTLKLNHDGHVGRIQYSVGSGCSSCCVEIGGLSGLEISLYSISANIRMLHSLGGPLSYLYTLTVDGRLTDAAGTNLYGSGSGRKIPVTGQPSGRRQPSYKCITDRARISLGYFPGWRTGGPFLRLRPSVHLTQALSNRLGACKYRKKHLLALAMT